jgi:hypothetical protein
VNYTIQKTTKHRQSFPNDEAAMKLLFMGLQNISGKWTMPIRDWGPPSVSSPSFTGKTESPYDVPFTQNKLQDLFLRFSDGKFKEPFSSRFVSDGAIKMFAYLVMLADPNLHKLLCIEEPENQLYPHLPMDEAKRPDTLISIVCTEIESWFNETTLHFFFSRCNRFNFMMIRSNQ